MPHTFYLIYKLFYEFLLINPIKNHSMSITEVLSSMLMAKLQEVIDYHKTLDGVLGYGGRILVQSYIRITDGLL